MFKASSLSCAFFLFFFTGHLHAHDNKNVPSTIQVQGHGVIDAVPDAFSITFIIEAKGQVVAKLNKQVEADLSQVVDFLLKEGVAARQIQSMQVRLTPGYESTPQGHRENGFVLSREVTLTHSELKDYDNLIDGILSRGVTRIQQFDFVITDQAAYYKQALTAAVHDAKQRAMLLSKELGVKLGGVAQISESGSYMPVSRSSYKMMQAEAAPSLPGQQSVSANINVTFLIHK
ncbi:SIMPL domain-containing protein [Alteromonas ponticola]|uniref:SIMPL domain-containing protein n=1 Tax=Alteromonas aquimaris TaxID=2998417 RepID=A0ABT3P6R0_9ALTE|nr:SIMPL domain-containing protein [Alteromonas aquimaris]MCW8108461.1 SIMPL domain-containing protein [Alteromonas aquimaris]